VTIPDDAAAVVVFAHGSGSSRRSPRNCFRQRVIAVIDWARLYPPLATMPMGLFGASTGAAAALDAAAARPEIVKAVVSRGGRPDLASHLGQVKAPTLLIVGGEDMGVIELNARALRQLQCPKRLDIVPGATHLFEEEGALENVATLAAIWFREHLGVEPHA
jgi:pimeloyl-ACP methyl ester carboxylesterase